MILSWFKNSCLPCFSFTTNLTNPNNTIESLPCRNDCVCILACCLTSLFMFVQQCHYVIFEYLVNMLLISARLESNYPVHIQRQVEHFSSSPAVVITSHWIASYLHYKATMIPIAIHSQQEPSISTLTQQGSLAVAQVVLSFLLFMLIYAFGV